MRRILLVIAIALLAASLALFYEMIVALARRDYVAALLLLFAGLALVRYGSLTAQASFAFALAFAFALTACTGQEAKQASLEHNRVARVQAGDTIVADVRGVPIHGSAVQAQARMTGSSDRKVALEELIDFELLGVHAKHEGYGLHQEVHDEARRAMVQRFLAETFEREFTRASIPEAVLRTSYEKDRQWYVHAELRDCVHLLVKIAKDATAEVEAQARSLVQELAQRVQESHAKEEFVAVAADYKEGSLNVSVEDLPVMPAEALDKPFADKLFALSVGQVSSPVRSRFGWHVIYLESITPPSNKSFEELRSDIVEKLWPEQRALAFERFVDGLREQHQIITNEAALAAVVVE